MKKSPPFQFKQFSIAHDKCAMKVNTDGILLGALAEVENVKRILDLGTGSGLVALMLAQRSSLDCQITALEIEPNAYQQAVENGKNSAWADRLHFVQGDVMQAAFKEKFDLIVSNPPYFQDSLATRNKQRDLARTALQSHLEWLNQAQKWLADDGKITMILPFEAGEKLIAQTELYCVKRWEISTKQNQPPKRMVVSFSRQFANLQQKQLSIYTLENSYTEEFKVLTQAFYLKM